MKTKLLLITLMVLLAYPSYADDCSEALNEAKKEYNAGHYSKAKGLFKYVQSECGKTYGGVNTWIQKCDQAKREAQQRKEEQSARNTTPSPAQTVASTLTVSKNAVSSSSYGTTETIYVSSNTAWEVQYATGTMYSVTRNGNALTVTINENTASESRNDYFNVKTSDGTVVEKISLSQTGRNTSTNSSYSSSNYKTRSYSRGYTALEDFNDSFGKWEMDWIGLRFNLCTGIEFEMSAFAFRYSFLKVEPLVIGLKYDFPYSCGGFYYQPDVKAVLPWSDEWAAQIAIGPSFNLSFDKEPYYSPVWFTAELGVLWHWDDNFSSDFFMRYDGMFLFGASFNFCTPL